MFKILKNVFLPIALLASVFGCAPTKYFYVKSEVLVDKNYKPAPEIISTSEYKDIAGKTKTVAVKAPDWCLGKEQSIKDVYVSSRRKLVSENCGIEMSTIERKIASEGYSVYSWKMLENMVSQTNKSYLDASRELGADVLFSVNDFEIITASTDDIIKRSCYLYDKETNTILQETVNPVYMHGIGRNVSVFERELFGASDGAAIDVTAIDVKTGKAFWFYKYTSYDLQRQADSMTAFLSYDRKDGWIVYMLNGKLLSNSERLSHSSTEYITRSNATNDFEKYIGSAVKGFISSFKAGE